MRGCNKTLRRDSIEKTYFFQVLLDGWDRNAGASFFELSGTVRLEWTAAYENAALALDVQAAAAVY